MDSQKILDWAAAYVKRDPDFYVPVKKLWVLLLRSDLVDIISLEEFTRMLQEDERFDFFEYPDVEREVDEEEERVMEMIGFFRGSRVGLKNRQPTRADMASILERKTQNILGALMKAWEVRCRDDPENEDRLLDVLVKAQKLKREIKKIFRGTG